MTLLHLVNLLKPYKKYDLITNSSSISIYQGVGTLMEESFDSSLDGEFRAALRKLYKKDMLTKLKVNIIACLYLYNLKNLNEI